MHLKPYISKVCHLYWVQPTSLLRVHLVGEMEKWNGRKYLIFRHVCLVGRMEKWKDRKLFCLVEKKSERMENMVCINLA